MSGFYHQIKQLKERLPSNIKILNEMSIFSVQEALKYFSQKIDITNLCEQIYNDPILIQKIDDQWKNLNFLKWEESSCTEKFWTEVNNYKDSADKKILFMNYVIWPNVYYRCHIQTLQWNEYLAI